MGVIAAEKKLLALAEKIKDTYTPGEIARLIRLIEPAPTTGEMSADQFENMMNMLDATSTRRGYSSKSREAARLVFVMGANEIEAAADSGLTQQAVNKLIQRIRRRMENVPSGWVSMTAWFPDSMANQIKVIADKLLLEHQSGKKLDADQSYNIVVAKSHS